MAEEIRIGVGNNTSEEITQMYFGEKRIQKAILGVREDNKVVGKKVFEDTSVKPWGTYVDEKGNTHVQGTVEDIKLALERHRNGIVNLYETPGWEIGRERKIRLAPIRKSGLQTLAGTTWVFKGRAGAPVMINTNPTNDEHGLPDFSNGKYWQINFDYYRVSVLKTNSKKKKKEWRGSFNGLAKISNLGTPENMYYLKIGEDGGYSRYQAYYNKLDTTTQKYSIPTWIKPSPYSSKYKLYLYKIGSETKTVISPYQRIKITGGEDATNPDLIKWLWENAKCTTSNFSSGGSAWEVPEAQSEEQVISLVLADKADKGYYKETAEEIMAAKKTQGFFLSSEASESEEDAVTEEPIFVVCQKEILKTAGYLLQKSKTEKDKKGNKVTTYYGSNSGSWNATIRRNWCNKAYYSSLPDEKYIPDNSVVEHDDTNVNLRSIFREFTWQLGPGNKTSGLTGKYQDLVALPLEKNILKTRSNSTLDEYNNYQTWEYFDPDRYPDATTMKYKVGTNFKPRWEGPIDLANPDYLEWLADTRSIYGTSAGTNYWLASPSIKNTTDYALITANGGPSSVASNKANGLSPFMII